VPDTEHDERNGVISMFFPHELANERTRSAMELAEQLRYPRRLRAFRRAERRERRAQRRLVSAWRRAAELRSAIESFDC
jgi:hypothetical protein